MPKILALLQARVTSNRLPRKVLLPVLGQPMLLRQVERLKNCHLIDHLMVVTSTEASDDALVEMCTQNKISFFRGSLDDVLDRFYQAALPMAPQHILRLTGDCPLTDPQKIDELIEFHLNGDYDYSSNALEPTLPDGLDAEIMKFEVLQTAWSKASLRSEREHVTAYIYKDFKTQPRFKIGSLRYPTDLSSLRWTVDEPKDFDLVTKVYENLYAKNSAFSMKDVLSLINTHPEFKSMNANIQRNEGYLKSLKMEQK